MTESLEPRTLSECVPGYPADHPQTLAELAAAEPDTITAPAAWFLRRQVIAASRAAERHDVNGPSDVLALLTNGYALHPWEGAWVSYALSARRQVILVPGEGGSMRSLRKATRLIPKTEDLPEIPSTAYRGPKKPGWLLIYGGTPDVLSKEHVAQGLATLQRRVPVADICFYQKGEEGICAPTLWSVRAQAGVSGTTRVEFPDPEALRKVVNP